MKPDLFSIELLQALVQQPSLSGQEGGVVAVAADAMRSLGFDEVQVDPTGNLVGTLHGELPGRRVLFDAHVDVVPATTPGAWQHAPFSGEHSAGRVWGRGATDNKGSLAAMIAGLAAVPRAELPGIVHVVASVGEEVHEGTGLAQVVDALNPDGVIVGEPTDCRLGFGQRGRARLEYTVRGTAAHSSAENQSGNAINLLGRLIQALERQEPPTDRWLGKGIQAPIQIISNPYPSLSTLPVECRLTVDRRLVLGESQQNLLAAYRQVIAALPGVGVELEVVTYTSYTGKVFTAPDFHPAWVTPPDSWLVQACTTALPSVGLPAMLYPVPYCTNGSYSAGVAGLPTVVFGPGSITQAHAMDEFLEVAELQRALQAYQAMARVVGKR